ncbi:MAG: hypothetical protein ACOCR6_00035 [archaeon]
MADQVDVAVPETRLLEELEWEGIASVCFIRDGSGTFGFLEVNPQLPASLPVGVHAGVEYPYYS